MSLYDASYERERMQAERNYGRVDYFGEPLESDRMRTIEPPTLRAMSAADYFGDYMAVSQSMLKDFADRRRLYEAYYVTRAADRPEPSDAMRKGTALHTALLEPEKFDSLVVSYPPGILATNGAASTKEAKAFRAENEAAGHVVLKEADAAIVRAMSESVRRVCGKWLDLDGCKEKSLYWTDETTGLPLKMRLDWLVYGKQPVIFDFKTTGDASPGEFRRACERFNYGIQHAQYIDGAEQVLGKTPLFYFVAVENKFPFACAIHELDASSAQSARMYRNDLLVSLRDCMISGDFSEPWERRVNPISLRPYCFEAA